MPPALARFPRGAPTLDGPSSPAAPCHHGRAFYLPDVCLLWRAFQLWPPAWPVALSREPCGRCVAPAGSFLGQPASRMLDMLQKASQRRAPFAAEPAGPQDLPQYEHSKEHASKHRPPLANLKTISAWLALQLVVVVAVYQAHERILSPRLHHGGAAAAEAELRRASLLQEQHASSSGGGGRATAGSWQLRGTALDTGGQGAPGSSGSGSSGGSSAPKQCKGCANCTVRLEEADEQVLRAEIDRISRALAEERAWPQDAPDATSPQELGDKVTRGQALQRGGAAVQQIVDEKFGPQSTANVPGVEDLHAELHAYNDAMVTAMTLSAADAAGRQHRTRAAELQLEPVDDLGDLGSLGARVAFLNQLYQEVKGREKLGVCMTATTAADLWGVRRELLPWMQYHTDLGVTHFYLLYDGTDAAAVELLGGIQHVTLMHLHPAFASAAERAKFEFYSKQARQWGGQPGNYELMVKQGYGEEEALRLAEADGMDWLMHVDPDELFYPGGPVASITAVLARQPPHVPAVRFMNFEGQPEAGDLTNRFEQVTLFRVHKHFITPEAHFYRGKYKLGDNAVFLTLYANGKAAVRVGVGARQLGPHFFAGDPSPRWQTQENPRGEWRDVVSDNSVVLHYAYAYMADVEAKANRSCPTSFLEAARAGDRSKIKACFVIDFDQDAYIAAAAGRAAVEDFFYSRMVLSDGSRVRCRDPENGNIEGWCTLSNIERFKYLMEKVGLMRRILGPQLIMRLHERAIQAGIRASGAGGISSGGTSAKA